jgi:hypothetical protein
MKASKVIVTVLIALSMGLIVVGTALASLSDGLVAYYPFNGNADDASGNGNNGVITGATLTADRFGQANGAYFYNGSGDFLQVPASTSLNVGLSDGLTVSAWIEPSNLTTFQPIVEWFGGAHFHILNNGSLYANIVDTTGNYHGIATAPNSVLANIYQHVALTYDKTTGVAVLYLNGNMATSLNLGIFTPETSHDLYNARINTVTSGYGDLLYYSGALDEVKIYNRVVAHPVPWTQDKTYAAAFS